MSPLEKEEEWKGNMETFFHFLQQYLGCPFYSLGNSIDMAWLFDEKEKKKGMEIHSFMHFLDNMEGKELKSFCKQVTAYSNVKWYFLINGLLWVNMHLKEGLMPLIL